MPSPNRTPTGLARLLQSTDQRQRSRELEAVSHEAELAQEKEAGIGLVTKRATFEAMQIAQLQEHAQKVAAYGAELYAMLAVAGTLEMANVIARLGRRLG